MNGWIKLHRRLQDWEWYTDSRMVHLFLHLLLSANHEDANWRGHVIKRGQLVAGRKSLAAATGMSEQSVRTCLERLQSTSEITIQPTNRFSIITLVNWQKYQVSGTEVTIQSTSQDANKQPASNHKQEGQERKEEKKPRGFDEKIVNELRRYDDIGNPTAYLAALKSKARPAAIQKAWSEWSRGNGIDSPGDFFKRAIHWEKDMAKSD